MLEPHTKASDASIKKQDSVASTSSKPSTASLPPSDIFEKEEDMHEAMEYNGMELPEEYLLAKLSFTSEHTRFFKTMRKDQEKK